MTATGQNEIWICPDALFDKGQLRKGRALCVSDGRVSDVQDKADLPAGAMVVHVPGILSPGFVDLQVNGGGGVLLNDTPTLDGMLAIARAHHQLGTVAILPTVITDDGEVLAQAVDAAIAAVGSPGIAGLHIEGPHISTERRGTHDPSFVRNFEDRTLGHIKRLRAAGVPTMITVAPEIVGSQHIAEMAGLGAVVSVGHSAGTAQQTHAAFAAGARSVTHLFNAMSPMQGREAGVTGAAINSGAYTGIICDGIHVSFDMVGLAIRARPKADRVFLVSDAMPTVGGPPEFTLYGKTIRLQGETLINAEGSLAGAHTTVAKCAQNAHQIVGVPAEDALKMGISVPCEVMGLGLDGVMGRTITDLIQLDAALQFQGSLTACLSEV